MIPRELDATELHCTRREDHRLGGGGGAQQHQRGCSSGYAHHCYCSSYCDNPADQTPRHHEAGAGQLEARRIIVAPDELVAAEANCTSGYELQQLSCSGLFVVVTSGRRTPTARQPDNVDLHEAEEGCYEPTSRPRLASPGHLAKESEKERERSCPTASIQQACPSLSFLLFPKAAGFSLSLALSLWRSFMMMMGGKPAFSRATACGIFVHLTRRESRV